MVIYCAPNNLIASMVIQYGLLNNPVTIMVIYRAFNNPIDIVVISQRAGAYLITLLLTWLLASAPARPCFIGTLAGKQGRAFLFGRHPRQDSTTQPSQRLYQIPSFYNCQRGTPPFLLFPPLIGDPNLQKGTLRVLSLYIHAIFSIYANFMLTFKRAKSLLRVSYANFTNFF